jgi:hypothetical protein
MNRMSRSYQRKVNAASTINVDVVTFFVQRGSKGVAFVAGETLSANGQFSLVEVEVEVEDKGDCRQ